tara:strand:- start:1868 stop:2188 length:321 start_codon:yes stop_codon:yes gene_type:complete
MTGFNQFLIEEPSIKKKKMKKVAIFLGAIAVFGLSSCNKCAECHAAADINGTEYEIMELGEYCGDELTSIEESGYDVTGTVYVDADGDSLPSPVTGNIEVHCGEDH